MKKPILALLLVGALTSVCTISVAAATPRDASDTRYSYNLPTGTSEGFTEVRSKDDSTSSYIRAETGYVRVQVWGNNQFQNWIFTNKTIGQDQYTAIGRGVFLMNSVKEDASWQKANAKLLLYRDDYSSGSIQANGLWSPDSVPE